MPKGRKGKKEGKAKKGGAGGGDAQIDALEAIDDGDGIPKHAVYFKLQFEIENIDIQDYKI